MSYTKATDFAAKDSLLSGNANKIIRGTEIDAEFTAIQADSVAQDAAAAVTATSVQNSTTHVLSSVAGTNTITGNLTPAITAYATGQTFHFVAASANTGATTIDINGLGPKNVTKNGTTALASGDIASGALKEISYDGTRFQLAGAGTYAASGANVDITSLGAVTGVTAAGGDNTTKLATTAYVKAASTTGTAANITGVAAIGNGGTGQTSAAAAMTALGGSIGVGQSWSSTGKSLATNYTNSTGRPIFVSVHWQRGSNTLGYVELNATVSGIVVVRDLKYFPTSDEVVTVQFVVPNGQSYRCDQSGMFGGTPVWAELA